MIREFLSRSRLIFFQKSWANSVSQSICGVHSPSGTLKIVNTANPSKGKSASFDVDIDAVWNRLRDRIDAIRREDDDQKLRDSKDETFGDKIQNGSTEDLTHDNIADWDEAVENSFVSSDSYGTISDSIGEIADIVDGILTDYLSADDIGVTVAEQDHSHTTADISNWGTATADFLTDADMSAYALDADLAALEEDVADIADLVDAIDTDLYDASGNKAWVDLTTNQTIKGAKKFSANGTNTALYVLADNEEMFQIRRGADADASALIYSPNRPMRIFANNKKILLEGSANTVVLSKNPTATASDTSSKAVATCGWAANLFSAKTHHHDDVYSKLGHTHSGYASTNHTHSGYASSSHNHAGVYAGATHQHVADDITDLGTAIDGKITTFSNTVSTTYATKTALGTLQNLVNEIDADLDDVIDYVDSMDEDIADLADWYSTGRSGSITVGGEVTWNGTTLTQPVQTITFTNGLVTGIGNATTRTIDTPVLFENT